jgi:hypothetical protein
VYKGKNDIEAPIDNLDRIPVKNTIIIAISLASFFIIWRFKYSVHSPLLKSNWYFTNSQIAYVNSMGISGQVIGAFCIRIYPDW